MTPVDHRAEPSGQREFWTEYQPGFRFTTAPIGSSTFFGDVEAHRYRLEPHIPEIAQFERWRDRDVLEVGCGIATDGLSFARAGARYVGVDGSEEALSLARQRFALEGRRGEFSVADARALPFDDNSFDLAYSHGVLHHIAETETALREMRRVLRPTGTALVMLYHRDSLNYQFTIMIVRRALAILLLFPGVRAMVGSVTHERAEVLEGHRRLLRRHGLRYLRDKREFLSNNTDGPGNPLSKAYSTREGKRLLETAGFTDVRAKIRYLNLRLFPGGDDISRTAAARRLERRLGWHLYLIGRPSS